MTKSAKRRGWGGKRANAGAPKKVKKSRVKSKFAPYRIKELLGVTRLLESAAAGSLNANAVCLLCISFVFIVVRSLMKNYPGKPISWDDVEIAGIKSSLLAVITEIATSMNGMKKLRLSEDGACLGLLAPRRIPMGLGPNGSERVRMVPGDALGPLTRP